MHRALTPGNGVRDSGGVRGRSPTAETADPSSAQCAFESRRPYSMETGVTGNTPDSGSGKSRFEPWVSSHASVAHQAERLPRKEQVGGSRPSRGSHALVAELVDAQARGACGREVVEVQVLSGALMPSGSASGRPFARAARPVRYRGRLTLAGCSVGRGRPALTRD
jgi:hypothetical protein